MRMMTRTKKETTTRLRDERGVSMMREQEQKDSKAKEDCWVDRAEDAGKDVSALSGSWSEVVVSASS